MRNNNHYRGHRSFKDNLPIPEYDGRVKPIYLLIVFLLILSFVYDELWAYIVGAFF